MDKGLTVPKWGPIVQLKIRQTLFGRSAQSAKNFGIFLKKGLHRASVVRAFGILELSTTTALPIAIANDDCC